MKIFLALYMNLVKRILEKFNGNHYPQDYLCLAKEIFYHPLYIYLVANRQVIKDITNHHAFIGYKPVIFSLSLLPEMDSGLSGNITIAFSDRSLHPNELLPEKDAIAILRLRKIKEQPAGDVTVFYYEASYGKHRFLSAFHQLVNRLSNRLYNNKQGNVFLQGNLFSQVQIAYSLPRTISLVTVMQQDLFNLFPTDLHGPSGEEHYIISLRHSGKAARQVEEARRILLTQVHCDTYQTVYSLGKNHMQGLKEKDNFPFSKSVSEVLHLPLPEQALYYRELELESSFIHGIHRIFMFRVLLKKQLQEVHCTLAHIHAGYASWRYNKGLSGNYLLR